MQSAQKPVETLNQNKTQNLMQSKPNQKFNCQSLKNNKIVKHIIKDSLHKLLHQFRSNNYDVNYVLRDVKTYLKSQQETDKKKQAQEIWGQLQVFLWHLSISPKYWITMLQNQAIYSDDTQTIDLHLFTSKIYKKVCQESKKTCQCSNIFFQIASDQVFFLLEQINIQICQVYQKGKEIIEKQVKQVTQLIKGSKIVNFYVLFKILMDISTNCYINIERQLQEGMFCHVQPSYSQTFAHYIIQKHEVLNLKTSQDQKKQTESQKQQQIMKKIKNSNNVKWRQAIRQDGEIGIMVQLQNQSETGDNENYIVKLDENGQIDVMSCNSVRLNWKVCKEKSERNNILSLIENKKKLAKKLRDVPTQIKTLTMMNNVTTIGGSLGKCLADIKKYDSASDFMMDLSKGAAISGSFNYLIYNVPLVGYLFVTGGYTYSFYSIFTNKYSTFSKKFQEMGNLTIDTASSLGSGVLGAFIGQTFIPVPVVGAFVGGLVGGFIGQIGGKTLSNYLQNSRFEKTIESLKKTIKPGGYWDTNDETLQALNIKRQKFFSTIPSQLEKRMNCDRLWITLICFTLYSFYESKQRKKFMQKSMEKLKKQKQKIQNFDISIQEYSSEYEYTPTLDMQCTTKYLADQRVEYVACLKELQQFMESMFSRLM